MAKKITLPINMPIVLDVKGAPKVQKAKKEIKGVGTEAEKTAGSFKSLAGAFTGMVVADRIKGMLESVIKPAAEVHLSLKQIQALTGVSEKVVGRMQKKLIEGADKTIYSQIEAGKAMLTLQRATGDTEFALEALVKTLGMAQGSFGALQVKDAAKIMAQLRTSFNLTGDEALNAADKMLRASKAMGIGLEDFRLAMGRLAMGRALAKQSFDDTMAGFSIYQSFLRNARRASQAYMTLLREMSQGGKAQEHLGGFFKDEAIASASTGKIISLRKFFMRLTDVANQGGGAMVQLRGKLQEAFGSKAAEPIIGTIERLRSGIKNQNGELIQGAEAWDELIKQMREGKLTVEGLAEEALEDPTNKLALASQAIQNLKVTVGATLLPLLADMATTTKSIFDALRAFAESGFGKFLTFIAARFGFVLGAVTALRLAVFGATHVFAGALGAMKSAGGALVLIRGRVNSLAAAYTRLRGAASKAHGAMAGVAAAGAAGKAKKGGLGGRVAGLRGRMSGVGGLLALLFVDELVKGAQNITNMFTLGGGDVELQRNLMSKKILADAQGKSDVEKLASLQKTRRQKYEGVWGAYKEMWQEAGKLLGVESEYTVRDSVIAKLQQKVKAARKKAAEDEAKTRIESAKKASHYLQLGSKGFEKAADELAKLAGKKHTAIDTRGITQMRQELSAMLRANVAGRRYRGQEVSEDLANLAMRGMHGIEKFKQYMQMSPGQREEAGLDLTKINELLSAGMSGMRWASASPQARKIQESVYEKFLSPFQDQMTPEAMKVAKAMLTMGGGMRMTAATQELYPSTANETYVGQPMKPLVPGGMFGPRIESRVKPKAEEELEKQSLELEMMRRQMQRGIKVSIETSDPRNEGNMNQVAFTYGRL